MEARTLFDFLRLAMQQRGWNVARLAEACDVDISLASKWVSETERKRVLPGTRSCRKIAEALGVDADYVLELAGHRQHRPDESEPDPIEAEVRTRLGEMREAVRDTPPQFWAAIIKATFDRAIDGARDMARLLAAAEDRAPDASADEDQSRTSSDASARRQRPIKPREPAFA